jgi:hypothetical protein
MKKTDIKQREPLSTDFIRVGDSYLKEVFKPDKDGNLYRFYDKREKGTVQEDLGGKSSDAYKNIKKYEGFVNVPSHTNYQQIIQGFFNDYFKVTHEPKEGKYDTITAFLNHVFGDKIDFALDYLQLIYTKPTQRLPIILLESKERGTGKSTFGNLLKLIFQDNSVKVGNADLDSNFNSVWVKRLAIIVDEASLEKNSVMQMLKRFSTETGRVTFNEKNKAQSQIDFFGKFILLSNEEGRALPIEKGENRFAVFKVPTFAEKGVTDNPNIETNFLDEIPSFLHFLINRTLVHKEESRMFFAPEVYYTQQLQYYFDNSHSATGRAIKELIIESFNFFEEERKLRFSVSNLCSELEVRFKYLDRSKVKKSLIEEFGMIEEKKNRFEYFSLKNAENTKDESIYILFIG